MQYQGQREGMQYQGQREGVQYQCQAGLGKAFRIRAAGGYTVEDAVKKRNRVHYRCSIEEDGQTVLEPEGVGNTVYQITSKQGEVS